MAIDDPVPSSSGIFLVRTSEPRRGLFGLFPPATRTELWGGLAFLGLSLLGAAWVLWCRSQALALEQDSVHVEGTVVRLWTTRPKGRTYYRVEYEYTAPSRPGTPLYRHEAEVDKGHFDQLQVGGPIDVKVCRTDPANHQVAGEAPRVLASAVVLYACLGLLTLLALGGIVNLWWWWIWRRRPPPRQVFVLFRFLSRT
jgi:hypothetical protein